MSKATGQIVTLFLSAALIVGTVRCSAARDQEPLDRRIVDAAVVSIIDMIEQTQSWPDTFCVGARLRFVPWPRTEPHKLPPITYFLSRDLPISAFEKIRTHFMGRLRILTISSCRTDRYPNVYEGSGRDAWLVEYSDVDVMFAWDRYYRNKPWFFPARTSLNENRRPPQRWPWMEGLVLNDGSLAFDGAGDVSRPLFATEYFYDLAEDNGDVRIVSITERPVIQ